MEYCPRLWQLDKQNIFEEFHHLLDYRHWKGRFKQLSDEDTDYSKLIDLSRISAEDTMIRRRQREKNWESVLTDDKKRRVTHDLTLLEDNMFRITSTDMHSFKELILCLQRQTRWTESLKWLDLIQKRKKYPHVFIKLKGVSLLKSGDETEGRKWLAKYRSAILNEYEDSVLLGSPMSVADQAAVSAMNHISIAVLTPFIADLQWSRSSGPGRRWQQCSSRLCCQSTATEQKTRASVQNIDLGLVRVWKGRLELWRVSVLIFHELLEESDHGRAVLHQSHREFPEQSALQILLRYFLVISVEWPWTCGRNVSREFASIWWSSPSTREVRLTNCYGLINIY